MWWWLWGSGALAADCDPSDSMRRGLQAWLGGDHAGTHAALAETEQAYGCSASADPQTLARHRILEGALLLEEGDTDSAMESFAAARRLAPDMWLPDLAPALREAWSRATDPPGTGLVVIEPAGDRPAWVDGAPFSGGEVPVGLHLVQVGGADGAVATFATTVWVGPGVATIVEAPLPVAPIPEPEPEPIPEPGGAVRVELQGLIGGSSAFGKALTAGDLHEPSVKIAVPIELGVGVAAPVGFARLQLGGAVLVGGQYLGSRPDGTEVGVPIRLDVGLAAGIGDEIRFGVAGGVQWPSRLAGRLLVGWSPAGILYGELRVGANLPTQRSAEPAGELLVGFRL